MDALGFALIWIDEEDMNKIEQEKKRVSELTELEARLLNLLGTIIFYSPAHNEHCSWVRNKMPCDCKQGQAHLKANEILHYYGFGYSESYGVRRTPMKKRYIDIIKDMRSLKEYL